jgi:hypothetical protein
MENSSIKKKRFMSIILVALSVMMVVIISSTIILFNKLEEKKEELISIEFKNKQLEEKLEVLENRSNTLAKLLEEKSEEKSSQIAQLEDQDYEKINKIMEMTPLDLESAMAVVKYSDMFDLDISLILSVIEKESNFNKYLVGSSNDRGLMQIIPGTEKLLTRKYGEKYGLEYNPDRIFEPEYNVGLASIYLDILRQIHGNDYNKILSEYNRGSEGLKEYFEANNTYETPYSKSILSLQSKYSQLN